MTLKKLAIIALANVLFFSSCTDDNEVETVVPRGDYENGLLISHEGNFGQGNASVAFVSADLASVEKDIYNNVNGELLGDVAQSIAFNGDLAYIVVNVSNKIEVVNRYTFQSVATIDSGLSNPRFMAFANGKGYVTNWGDFSDTSDDKVAVINLSTNTVEDNISTSYLPETIVASNNNLYVATGIFGNGNVVDVISSSSDTVIDNITVGNSPNSLQLDASGDIWVSSSESLDKISTGTNTVTTTINLDSSASLLNYNLGSLYFVKDGAVFRMSETASTLPETAVVSDVNFYGMTVQNGIILGVDAKDFSSNGELQVYNGTTGANLNNLELDIIPAKVYFN